MNGWGNNNLDDELYVLAREGLLQGLTALEMHLDSVILVGAQAIYLHTQRLELPVAPFTSDGDLVIHAELLKPFPSIDQLMRVAGFLPNPNQHAVGSWINSSGIPIDLLVPVSQGGKGRRSAKLPHHGDRSIRKTAGLEAVRFDNSKIAIESLAGLSTAIEVSVAGPTSLLISKLIKLGDRSSSPRFQNKDAYDIYRLLLGTQPSHFLSTWQSLTSQPTVRSELGRAINYLAEFFAGSPNSSGCVAAGKAENTIGDPDLVAQRSWALGKELLSELKPYREF